MKNWKVFGGFAAAGAGAFLCSIWLNLLGTSDDRVVEPSDLLPFLGLSLGIALFGTAVVTAPPSEKTRLQRPKLLWLVCFLMSAGIAVTLLVGPGLAAVVFRKDGKWAGAWRFALLMAVQFVNLYYVLRKDRRGAVRRPG